MLSSEKFNMYSENKAIEHKHRIRYSSNDIANILNEVIKSIKLTYLHYIKHIVPVILQIRAILINPILAIRLVFVRLSHQLSYFQISLEHRFLISKYDRVNTTNPQIPKLIVLSRT